MLVNKNNIGFVIRLIGAIIFAIPLFSIVGVAQTSTLQVSSDPGGAAVYVDGVYKGQTNTDLSPLYIYNIPYGSHLISMAKGGCNQWEAYYDVSVPTTTVLASLTCPSLLGTFIINSIPDGGGVYIDNNFKGFTPKTISDVPYGSHAVKIVKSGYQDWIQNWLAGASPQTITAYLVPLPTPTPTPTTTGTLLVSSDPGGGSVYVDGVYKGLTPVDISQSLYIYNVPYGSHVIKITRNGCDDWIQTYQVSAPTTTVLAPLTCVVPTGTFIINSDPSGASVYLDNNYKGTTPLTLTNIPQGSHAIKVTKTGYQDWTQTYQTSTGTLTITANLIPVPTPTPTTPTPTPTATPDMGYIYVWSSPAGGSIYVDGNYKGLTDSNQYVIISTTTGYHAVEISKTGYDKYSTSVYVYFGQGATVNAYLISIPTPTVTPTPTRTPTPTPTVNGLITGTVTDAFSGMALVGVVTHGVSVTAGGLTATTGPGGSYSISIAPSIYTVAASANGFMNDTAIVTVVAGATVIQNFALQPIATPTQTITTPTPTPIGEPIRISKIQANRNPVKISQTGFSLAQVDSIYSAHSPLKYLRNGLWIKAKIHNEKSYDVNGKVIVNLVKPDGVSEKMQYKNGDFSFKAIKGETFINLPITTFDKVSFSGSSPKTGEWKVELLLYAEGKLVDRAIIPVYVFENPIEGEILGGVSVIPKLESIPYIDESELAKWKDLITLYKLVQELGADKYKLGDVVSSDYDEMIDAIEEERAAVSRTAKIWGILADKSSINDEITYSLSWENFPAKSMAQRFYDRSTVVLSVTGSTLPAIVDNGGANQIFTSPIQISGKTLNKTTFVWYINGVDKQIKPYKRGDKHITLKWFEPGSVFLEGSLYLELGPTRGVPGTSEDAAVYDYEEWQKNPSKVYWSVISMDRLSTGFNVTQKKTSLIDQIIDIFKDLFGK